MVSIAFDENGERTLVKYAVKVNPITDPSIILQLVIPVTIKNKADKRMINLLVSPIDPGIHPINMFNQEKSKTVFDVASFNKLTALLFTCPAGMLKAVAPENPSGATAHTLSPEICTG